MLSTNKKRYLDVLEEARGTYFKIKEIIDTNATVNNAYAASIQYVRGFENSIKPNQLLLTDVEDIVEDIAIGTITSYRDFQKAIDDHLSDGYSDRSIKINTTCCVLIALKNRAEFTVDDLRDQYKQGDTLIEDFEDEALELDYIYLFLKKSAPTIFNDLDQYWKLERFVKNERRNRKTTERVDNKLNRTHGLMHIHTSRHPTAIRAHKTTPKRKNTLSKYENSVRRMF